MRLHQRHQPGSCSPQTCETNALCTILKSPSHPIFTRRPDQLHRLLQKRSDNLWLASGSPVWANICWCRSCASHWAWRHWRRLQRLWSSRQLGMTPTRYSEETACLRTKVVRPCIHSVARSPHAKSMCGSAAACCRGATCAGKQTPGHELMTCGCVRLSALACWR